MDTYFSGNKKKARLTLSSSSADNNNNNKDAVDQEDPPPPPPSLEIQCHLSKDSWMTIIQHVLDYEPCELKQLMDLYPKDVISHVKLFNKTIPIPRRQCLYGDATYSFSGVTLSPNPNIPSLVQKCIDYARSRYGEKYHYNGALVNWYKDGNDYIGPHSDNESDMVLGAPILSFSFGASRLFRITKRHDCKHDVNYDKKDLVLCDNTLVIMGGKMQKEFKHQVPKMSKVVSMRVNITVRSFKHHLVTNHE